jgi:small-conductance mechanosensitive channel
VSDAEVLPILVRGALVAVVAGVLGWALAWMLRSFATRRGWSILQGSLWRSPVVAITVLAALTIYHQVLGRRGSQLVGDILAILLICAIAWLGVVFTLILERAALARHPQTDITDLGSRHARTQITLLRRVTVALIVTVAIAAVLWTFPTVRSLGASLLASAGVLGIIAGLAAQTTLGNVFSGLQIAFTDALRVGDIVELGDHWGRIESITLTYVVLRIWDGTSLIVPSTFFTTTPFRNWTHAGAQVIGQVELAVDWTVPVDEVRSELQRIVQNTPLWDGRSADLTVERADGPTVVLRATVSCARGDDVYLLQCQVREGLVQYLQQQPGYVPTGRLRVEGPS